MWLLARMLAARNAPLAFLLVVAIGLFAWRILHYANEYRRPAANAGTPVDERRRIRIMVPVLAALLGLHAWLITLTVAMGDLAFTALLVLAVVVFAVRLAIYALRYGALRRGAP